MRGCTTPATWFDEIAFTAYIDICYKSAAPATSKAMELAAANNRPHGMVITTTPNMLSNQSGLFAYTIMRNSLQFDIRMYDLGPAKVKALLDTVEYPYVFAQYNFRELGRDDKWFRKECRGLLNDLAKIKREIMLEWPVTGEGSVFTEETLSTLHGHVSIINNAIDISALDPTLPPNLQLTFNREIDFNAPYPVGVDTATGAGVDDTAFTFLDPDTMETVASLASSTIDDETTKKVAKIIFDQLFPKAVPIVERNYLGIVLINYLLKIDSIKARMFYTDQADDSKRTIEKNVKARPNRNTKTKRVYGINTTNASRETMMRIFVSIVNEQPFLVTHKDIQDQVNTMYRTKTGRIDHRPGFHDDRLFAMLLVHFADTLPESVLPKLIAQNRGEYDRRKRNLHIANRLNQNAMTSKSYETEEVTALPSVAEYVEKAQAEPESQRVAQKKQRAFALLSMLNGGDSSELTNLL